ncbi:MAG: ion channel [Aestuariivirga sp.]
MIVQILIGMLVIAITVAFQAEMLAFLNRRLEAMITFERRFLRRYANTGVIITTVLFILGVQLINVMAWAMTFLAVGAFDALEPAVYFALVSFTTAGFGDITLGPDWRLLSGLTTANGFLMFGWSTAYMVELMRRTA